jgi:ribulose 1,5-bisphosphate synthetase/thiazole synthase
MKECAMQEITADIVVVGGGPSGTSAAVAAARCGAKVLLIEEDNFVGGAAVDYGVQSLEGDPSCGIRHEIRERLKVLEPHLATTAFFHSHWIVKASDDLFAETPGLTVWRGTPALDAIVEQRHGVPTVTGVIAYRHSVQHSGHWKVSAKVVIDCSGDGDIAAFAGCEFRYGREGRREFNEKYAATEDGDNRVMLVTWMYTSQRVDPASPFQPKAAHIGQGEYLHWGCKVECQDTTSEEALQSAQREAWKQMLPDFDALRANGFRLNALAPRIGVRESRRFIGDYVLKEADIVEGRHFDDGIALSRKGIDPWEPEGTNPYWTDKAVRQVPYCQIPYRCLIPRGYDGILVAGRCISGTHLAMSSYRVMGTVASIGQAAGIAAALAVQGRKSPRDVDPKAITAVGRTKEQGLVASAEEVR